MIGRHSVPLVHVMLGLAIAGRAVPVDTVAASSSSPVLATVELDGRRIDLPLPPGLTHGPELTHAFRDQMQSTGGEVLAVFWPDSAMTARREGRLREVPFPTATVVAFRGDKARTPREGLAYVLFVERNRQQVMQSSSMDSALHVRVQRVLSEDPEGQADRPIPLDPDSRVCLDIFSVRGRATVELQMIGSNTAGASGQAPLATLRALTQVVLRDDVIGMFLIQRGRPTTRAVAELKHATVAWVEETLLANGAVAARPRPASDSDPSLPKFGEFVYAEELPEAVTRVSPEYPEDARILDISGTVTITALVGRDGKVKETRVTTSIGLLDDAAEAAVRKWKFKPAVNKGAPVAVWVSVPVTFTLE